MEHSSYFRNCTNCNNLLKIEVPVTSDNTKNEFLEDIRNWYKLSSVKAVYLDKKGFDCIYCGDKQYLNIQDKVKINAG